MKIFVSVSWDDSRFPAFSSSWHQYQSTAILIIFAILLLIISIPVCAEENHAGIKPSNSPVEVTSKKMTAKMVSNGVELIFDGKVKVKQDDLNLSCDRLVGFYEDERKHKSDGDEKNKKLKDVTNSVKSAVATGNIKITKGDLRAEAGKAILDNVKRTVTLSEGPPKVWQGPHMLVAQSIIIYLDENRAELISGDESGIKAILNPGKDKK
jgi:lipopolysaccharide transport protein LptA